MPNIIRQQWLMNRRAVLKGAAGAFALPLLDAMTPMSFGAAADGSNSPAPKRVVFLSHQFGFTRELWNPKEIGQEFAFPRTAKRLEPFRDQLTMLSGMANPKARTIHGKSSYEFLTCEPFPQGNEPYVASLDQVIADRIGGETRYASLQFAAARGSSSFLPISYIDGAPLDPIVSPQKIFAMLFDPVGDLAEVDRRFRGKQSILDALTGSASRLTKQLGKADRQKLDQYLSSVRSVERALQQQKDWARTPKPKPPLQKYTQQEFEDSHYNTPNGGSLLDLKSCDLYMELIALALQTDQTRVIAHQINVGGNPEDAFGHREDHHSLSHSHRLPDERERMFKVEDFKVKLFADLLKRLQETPETGGSLLDNTLVFFGSPNGEGGHTPVDLPIVLAGNLDGRLNHGQHIRYEGAAQRKTPLSNLFLTMLHAFDIEVERFRDSQTTVSELL